MSPTWKRQTRAIYVSTNALPQYQELESGLYNHIVQLHYIWISLQSDYHHGHLKWQLIGRLGDVALNDVGSCDGWDIDGGLFVYQQAIPFVVNLKKNRMRQLTGNVEVGLAVLFKAL